MKIKCKTTIAIAREDDRGKPHIQLYKDKVIDVDDTIGLTAINLGFAVKCDESKTSEIQQKMVDTNHKNKMMDSQSVNKEVKRGRPPKSVDN